MNKMTETQKANQRLVREAWKHVSEVRKTSYIHRKQGYRECTYSGCGCPLSVIIKKRFIDHVSKGAYTQKKGSPIASSLLALNNSSVILKKWALSIDPCFADDLQSIHDGFVIHRYDTNKFVDYFFRRLNKLCEDQGLKKVTY